MKKRLPVKAKRAPRPGSLQQLTDSTAAAHQHEATFVMLRQRELLAFEAGQVEETIVHLQGTIRKKQQRLNQLNAQISGIDRIVQSR